MVYNKQAGGFRIIADFIQSTQVRYILLKPNLSSHSPCLSGFLPPVKPVFRTWKEAVPLILTCTSGSFSSFDWLSEDKRLVFQLNCWDCEYLQHEMDMTGTACQLLYEIQALEHHGWAVEAEISEPRACRTWWSRPLGEILFTKHGRYGYDLLRQRV